MATDGLTTEAILSPVLNVLIVEDTPSSQKLMSLILEASGHLVQVTDNGIDAIRNFRRSRPHVIVMDLQLPGIDGLQTTSILRALEEKSRVPVVAVTSRKQKLDQERFKKVGVDAILLKPFNCQEFLNLIENVSRTNYDSITNLDDNVHPNSVPSKDGSQQVATTNLTDVLNISQSLERLGGDKDLFRDLVTFFFEDYPVLQEEMHSALTRQDWFTLQRTSHSLKGLAANFSASRAQRILQEIENTALSKNAETLNELLLSADRELAQLAAALAEYLSEESQH
jgi:two-component system, sensor histidine kinase and response regulator